MLMRKWPYGLSLFLGLALWMLACDDQVTQREFVNDVGGDFSGLQPDVQEKDTSPAQTLDTSPIEIEDCCILIPAGGVTSYEVNVNERISLGVILYSKKTGQPVAGERIAWTFDGQGDAAISSLETLTDEHGTARIDFIAGEVLSTYHVQASYVEADPVDFDVQVIQLPTGDLQVNVFNAGAAQLEVSPFDIYVYPSQVGTCRHLNPLLRPSDELGQATVQNSGENVVFADLLAGEEFLVLGVGYGENGDIIAKGCAEGILIREDQTTEADLVFQLIPLNPVGTYRVRSYFNFGDALASTGPVGEYLVKIFDGFDDPGMLLYDTIFDLCGEVAPDFICELVDAAAGLTGIKQEIANAITEAIINTHTGCSIIRAGCNVRDTVRNLELLSTLYLSKMGADFNIHGSTTFTGLALRWGEERYVLTHQDLQNSNLELMSGDWDASVIGYNHLMIGAHPLDLRYGELIVYIINELVLPALTNDEAHNFEDALIYWFNCDGIAQSLSDHLCAFGECISYDTAYNICTGTLHILSSGLNMGGAILSLQTLPATMQLSGEVDMVKAQDSFLVEKLINGSWHGAITINGNSGAVSASWSGCNLNIVYPENSECYCDSPEFWNCPYPHVDFVFGSSGACRCNEDCSNCN